VLWVAAVVALIAVVLSALGVLPPLRKLGGLYSGAYGADLGLVVRRVGFFLARLAAGTGLLPLGVAVAWGIRHVLRPSDPQAHAFAVVAAAMAVCVLVPTAGFTIGSPSVFEERYLLYLSPLPFLGAAAAIARRDLSWPASAAGMLAVCALVGAANWDLVPQPYDPFTNPALRFYATELQIGGRWTTPVLAALAGAGLAYALRAARGRRANEVALTAVTAVAFLQLAALQSTMRAFADGPGERHGPRPAERGWIDRAIYGRGRAMIFGEGLGNSQQFAGVWAEAQFWNTSLAGTAPTLVRGSIATPPGDADTQVAVDRRTGRLVTARPLTRFLVIAVPGSVRHRSRIVAEAGYVPLQLIEPERPPQATHMLIDFHYDGWMTAGEPATLRVFGRGLDRDGRHCLAVDLEPPPGAGPGSLVLHFGGMREVVRLASGEKRRVVLGLPGDAPAHDFVDLRLDSPLAGTLGDGRSVGPKMTVVSLGRCPRR
jgi:hypothetical protein